MAGKDSGVSGGLLRPDPAALGDEWRRIVEAEYEQVERLREWHEEDHYRPVARDFVDDPRRTDDPLLNALVAHARPGTTWVDIGAAAGRYALPLALHAARVIAVEPSASMRAALSDAMVANGITNVEVVPASWPEAAADVRGDYSLMAHVGYDIREINPFLDAMERATARRCFAVLMERAPSSGFNQLWEQVHGEPRILLPAMPEFLHLLLARGATPDVRVFRRQVPQPGADEVRLMARRRLWLREGSSKDRLLQRLLDDLLTAGPVDVGGPTKVALISWSPDRR